MRYSTRVPMVNAIEKAIIPSANACHIGAILRQRWRAGSVSPMMTLSGGSRPPLACLGQNDTTTIRGMEEASRLFSGSEGGRNMAVQTNPFVGGNGDVDTAETREWLDSLDSVLQSEGTDRARYLLSQLTNQALRQGIHLPFTANTSYI